MKVALVNSNPAVSRLATLSLSKIGYEYIEVYSLDDIKGRFFDILILDSEITVQDVNLEEIAGKILYLSSKSSPEFDRADKILPKPFLPTEFISIVESLGHTQDQNLSDFDKDEENFSELKDEQGSLVSIEDSEFVDELSDELFKDEFGIKEDTEDESFSLDDFDMDLTDKNEEVGNLDSTSENISIDNEEDNLEEFDDFKDEEPAQMTSREEDLLSDFGFDDDKKEDIKENADLNDFEIEESLQLKDELSEENEHSEVEELSDEMELEDVNDKVDFETEDDTFADIRKTIDEIDSLDSELNLDEFEDKSESEFANDHFEMLKKYKNLDTQDQVGNEDFIKESDEMGDFTFIDQESEFKSDQLNVSGTSEYDDIDHIKEEDLAKALNEDFASIVEPTKSDLVSSSEAIKKELAHKIGEQITGALSADSIKEALKGLNIKINITFEEK
ncbi:hypothetical protein [Campylobacter sp. RM16192]|uniref:hypothetical protein n=1 Tax=Campylobacter sp. RM16192 TaxID=1660080 RepID=UPI001451F994|nr:hypothetical protein [Campylobacter sp. RM16192]QCD52018.1 hypothetical protein CDOMC_0364 [Campylobacter sp. RM16192]